MAPPFLTFNLDNLAKKTLPELRQLLAQYKAVLAEETDFFNDHKKEIIRQFEEKYRLYKRGETIPVLLETEVLFFQNIRKSKSIAELNQFILSEIQRIRGVERDTLVLGNVSLVKLIEDEHVDLCKAGKLPRSFKEHVVPAAKTILRECKKRFDEIVGSSDSEDTKRYRQVFVDIERQINRCDNEENLKTRLVSLLETEYPELSKSINDNMLVSPLSPVKWVLANTSYHFKSILNGFYNDIRTGGYLERPKVIPGNRKESAERAVLALETQIDLHERACESKIKEIISENKKQVRLVLEGVTSVNINRFFNESFEKFIRISEKKRDNTQDSVESLKSEFDLFWKDLTLDSAAKLLESDPSDNGHWTIFSGRIRYARRDLIRLSYFRKDYLADKRFEIIDICRAELAKSYRHTMGSAGDTRKRQIEDLFDALYKTENESQARSVIENALFYIKSDHQTNSILYNLVSVRKQSRAVNALERALDACARKELIPAKNKEKTVSAEIEEELESYFNSDVVLNTRSRRVEMYKMLETIKCLENLTKDEKISAIDAKQMMTTCIDDAIDTVNRLHKFGEGVARISRIVASAGDSRFVEHLRSVRVKLIREAKISDNYVKEIWPEITRVLSEALRKVSRTAEGMSHAETIITSLMKAGDSINASSTLYLGIKSLETDDSFLPVKRALESGYTKLVSQGTLPDFEKIDPFSQYMGGLRPNIEKMRSSNEELRKMRDKLAADLPKPNAGKVVS